MNDTVSAKPVVTVLPNISCAVIRKLWATPAVVLEGNRLSTKWLAAAALTVMAVCLPVILLLTVSVAVMDWLPADRKIAGEVWAPAPPAGERSWAVRIRLW